MDLIMFMFLVFFLNEDLFEV